MKTLFHYASGFALAAIFAGITMSAQAQIGPNVYGGGSYGNVYGGYGNNAYGNGFYGAGNFRNPLTYGGSIGYGGYGYGGYGYRPTYIYRSPASLASNNSTDPYHRTNLNTLQESMRRFKDLREDSRSADQYYSNEVYKADHPFDEFYYERMMTGGRP